MTIVADERYWMLILSVYTLKSLDLTHSTFTTELYTETLTVRNTSLSIKDKATVQTKQSILTSSRKGHDHFTQASADGSWQTLSWCHTCKGFLYFRETSPAWLLLAQDPPAGIRGHNSMSTQTTNS